MWIWTQDGSLINLDRTSDFRIGAASDDEASRVEAFMPGDEQVTVLFEGPDEDCEDVMEQLGKILEAGRLDYPEEGKE